MRIPAYFRNLPLRVLVLTGLFLTALLLFGYIIHEFLWEHEGRFDQTAFAFFHRRASSNKTQLMAAVTFFASTNFLLPAYSLLIGGYLLRRQKSRALDILTIGLSGHLVLYVLKTFFKRQRPENALLEPLTNFSFPSGHASSGFIFYGLIIYLVWKTDLHLSLKWLLAFLLISWALLIGISRIYLRYHYASDVMAGFCVGIAWLSLSIWILEYYRKKEPVKLR